MAYFKLFGIKNLLVNNVLDSVPFRRRTRVGLQISPVSLQKVVKLMAN